MANAPGTKTLARKATRSTKGGQNVVQRFRQYLALRRQSDLLGEQVDTLKKGLMTDVETKGYTDDKGHQWLDLDEPVENEATGKVCRRLKREQRISQPYQEDVAEEILKKAGLWIDAEKGGVLVTVVQVDEEALEKAYYQNKITAKQWEAMFPKKISYAFTPQWEK